MIVIVDAVFPFLVLKWDGKYEAGGRCGAARNGPCFPPLVCALCAREGGATFTSLSDDAAVSFSETVSKPRAELVHKTSTCTRTKHTDIRFYSKERLA